jgi:cobalamin biosynthesis protein CobT
MSPSRTEEIVELIPDGKAVRDRAIEDVNGDEPWVQEVATKARVVQELQAGQGLATELPSAKSAMLPGQLGAKAQT